MKKAILLLLAVLFPTAMIFVYFAIFGQTGDGGWNFDSPCTFKSLTGLECPGCGGQRAIHFLLHGQILTAMRYNLFFVIALPFLCLFYIRFVQVYILEQKQFLRSFAFSPYFAYALLIGVILFFILRNIPFTPFSYLAPPV